MDRKFLSVAVILLLGCGNALGGTNPPKIVSGTLEFTKQVIATDVDQAHSVQAADFDGDGDLDVAATDYVDGLVFYYENDGAGGFTTQVLDPDLAGAYPSAIGDVDLDGDTDLLACGYLADSIVWYESDGSGNFVRHDVDTAADGAHSVVPGDMDEDGDIDLLTTSQDAGTVAWYENDGSLNFTRHLIDGTATGAKRAEFGDMDGDGDLDVVAGNYFTNEVAWYENDGNENFTKQSIDTTVIGAYFVHPVDIDVDGDLDILSASRLDDSIRLYWNNGGGSFTVQMLDPLAEGARSVITADIDGDGDLDPVSTSVLDDTIGWYENNGDGSFTQRAVDVSSDGVYGTFVIDFDNDGDIDVLSASRDANAVAIHHQGRFHRAFVANVGGTLQIGQSLLLSTDSDDAPAQITYTVSAGPSFGEVRVSGLAVPVGGTFTQDDIDNDRVTYVHDGSDTYDDVFSFTVADGGSGGFSPAGGTFSIAIGNSGLAHWPLDESSGLVASDVVGSFDGNLVGGPVWQPAGGNFGGSLQFDGVDDLVDVGAIDFDSLNGMTISMWIHPDSFAGDYRLISKTTGGGEQDHYWMISSFEDSKLRFRLKAGGVTSTLITGMDVLEVGQWCHVACTYDKNEMKIYANGTLVASMAKTGAVDLGPAVSAAIGNQPPGAGSSPFHGMIDDVRLFKSALSEGEIGGLITLPVVSALTAAQRKTGNDMDGTTAINLAWDAPGPGADSAEIWRNGFGDYPEYDDGAGSVPALPATAGNGWTLVTTLPASSTSFTDEPATRDFWYYRIRFLDANDAVSGVSNMTGGTLNYHLGDVVDSVEPFGDVGDNVVDVADIALLGANYQVVLSDPPPDSRSIMDVGPTTDFGLDARPTTDNRLQFEDLILFGINYSHVGKDHRSPPPAAANAIKLLVESNAGDRNRLEVSVRMTGNGKIQGLSVPLVWDSRVVRPVGMRAGDLLDNHGGVNLVLSPQPGTIDAALCGVRPAGISGEGLLATMEFRVLSDGDPKIALGETVARDAANRDVVIEGSVERDTPDNSLPSRSMLHRAAPNPFNPATRVSFSLEVGGSVKVQVFSMRGQLVKTLVDRDLEPGIHSLMWDGKDGGGKVVSSGTYLLRMVAPDQIQSRKITMMK